MRLTRALALIIALIGSSTAQAQVKIQIGAHGAVSGTYTDRVAGGGNAKELRPEQTMLMANASLLSGHLDFTSALSLDRAISDDGVLTLGGWGGGFYDRHHPHDYLTEAVVSLVGDVGTTTPRPRASVSVGKGLVPFGPQSPMDRPALRVPANHEWSQIMERWFGSFAIRGDRIGMELAAFNGGGHSHGSASTGGHSEHEGHGACTTCDTTESTASGSARITAWPTSWMEVRVSGAIMRSAGHHAGAGGEHQMLNLATSIDRALGRGRVNALVEYGQVHVDHTYRTMLGEVQLSRGRYRAYYRGEQSERAEGARADRFRSAPELQANAVGTTRWTVHTVGTGAAMRKAGITFEPIAEFGVARVSSVGPVPIDVAALYGSRTLWSGVIALRTSIGAHHEMGRYGAMADRATHAGAHQH